MTSASKHDAGCRGFGLSFSWGLAVCWLGVWMTTGSAAEPVVLREVLPAGTSTQVWIELKAEGLFRPALPPSEMTEEARMPKPLALDVKTRLVFRERLLVGPSDREDNIGSRAQLAGESTTAAPRGKAVRWVAQAASAINGEVRPTADRLRPELLLLVAERQGNDGVVVVVSPAGPMTRGELELVEGLGDPLTLGDLLPRRSVSRGDSWTLPAPAQVALSGYDVVKSSTLQATLEEVDPTAARLRFQGQVQGEVLGGAGTIQFDGRASFNHKAGMVDRLELKRTESRQAGPVEAGLDVKSTLTVIRRLAPLAPELADSAIAGQSLDTSPPRQLLQLIAPQEKYNLLHDRSWHTYWDDPKLVVLKRIEKGRVVAQCNLAAGPPAGRGKHQDPRQFRDDIRRSLKDRFVQFLGAGEVDGDPAGGFRYKVGVQGREEELGVLWYYYLVGSPEGDQLLATFTLAQDDAKSFGDQDLQLIGSLQWSQPGGGKKP